MEIHRSHKHHSTLKATTLLFEFFMMFLAITGGFFMENKREHYIERHREKEYIESMVKDVKQDTIGIQDIITTGEKQISGIDSLIKVLETPVAQRDFHSVYRLTMTHLNRLFSFKPNQITITQLKNFGGLRLISNKSVSDSIVSYYSTYDSHVEQQRYIMKFLQETLQLEIVAMDFSTLRDDHPKFRFDQCKSKEFYNRTLLFQSLLDDEVKWMKDFQKQSIALLKYMEKEYEFEE
jgi:hypothetical protein